MSDLLLAALGTLGMMPWPRFKKVIGDLCLTPVSRDIELDINNLRNKVVRSLDSLGHCEFDFEGSKVYPCPPSLVLLPGEGVYRAVFTGVRNPDVTQKLDAQVTSSSRIAWSDEPEPQHLVHITEDKEKVPVVDMPSTQIFESMSKEHLAELAASVGASAFLEVPAAWALANFSVSLSEYDKQLVKDLTRDDELLDWVRRDFSTERLSFVRDTTGRPAEGLEEYGGQKDHALLHYLWVGDSGVEVDRDWGRYLALSSVGRKVIVYDEWHQHLVVPDTVPLPRFLARAATLCSGRLPSLEVTGEDAIGDIPPGTPVNIYSGVPVEYSSLIAEKVGQPLVTKRLRFNKKGELSL